MTRPSVVVCGTTFGQFYLEAFRRPESAFRLTGVVARGSDRSRATAARLGVPLHTDPADIPEDTDLVCMVVRAGVAGGLGTELTCSLLQRGFTVLQEHPLHHDELARCLRTAWRVGAGYRLNTHYRNLEPVRRFVDVARSVLSEQPALYVDAACSTQVAFPLLDILGSALGVVRPWAFGQPASVPDDMIELAEHAPPFRVLHGVLGGVPLTLRIQNQTHPSDPDNYLHLLHRITIGVEGGQLTLTDTHGQVLWTPRLHVPASVKESFDFTGAHDELFDQRMSSVLGPAETITQREALSQAWPRAIEQEARDLLDLARRGADPLRRGQFDLAICEVWRDLTTTVGFPEPLFAGPPRSLNPARLNHV